MNLTQSGQQKASWQTNLKNPDETQLAYLKFFFCQVLNLDTFDFSLYSDFLFAILNIIEATIDYLLMDLLFGL